jgi:Zn ribbon nucleic-acid-binding protein
MPNIDESTVDRTTPCWVCAGRLRSFWTDSALEVVECVTCGHLQAAHRSSAHEASDDYHRGYEQGAFVESLRVTRQRQAGRLLDAIATWRAAPRSLFDFGCGRGWLLEVARERGISQLAGGDVSDLALQLLSERHIAGLKLDPVSPFEKLDFRSLGFDPEVITFLDVIEHFSGDLTQRLTTWLERLPSATRMLVFKVPMREGLLFSIANQARRLGVGGLQRQLFQVGTYPPHYQYFTRRSLARFVSSLGLETLGTLDDLDFEPTELAGRLTSALPLVRRLGGVAGHLLASAATGLRRRDSRILVAERRS